MNLTSHKYIHKYLFMCDLEESKKREEVLIELKKLQQKLNIKFYEVTYLMNYLNVDDFLEEKDFNDIEGLIEYLKPLKEDCIKLQRRKEITKFGLGQLKTIELIEKYIRL